MKFKLMDPNEIIAVIVVLIVLGVGVFAFFVTSTSLVSSRNLREPCGNNNVLSGNRSIPAVTGAPIGNGLMWLNCSGIVNSTAGIKLEGWNTTTTSWVTVQAVGAANGTVESTNSTYRVSKRTVYGTVGSPNWKFLRCYYSVNGSGTTPNENSTFKALKNETGVASTVFNILGIVITISAIMSIISVIYLYMRPKQ